MPRRVVIQGKTGSGKSTVIRCVTATLARSLGPDSFKLVAPTDAAAININGGTIHASLKLCGQTEKIKLLRGKSERSLQLGYQKVRFIICDEYSMVGCRLLNAVNSRCQQATAIYDNFLETSSCTWLEISGSFHLCNILQYTCHFLRSRLWKPYRENLFLTFSRLVSSFRLPNASQRSSKISMIYWIELAIT